MVYSILNRILECNNHLCYIGQISLYFLYHNNNRKLRQNKGTPWMPPEFKFPLYCPLFLFWRQLRSWNALLRSSSEITTRTRNSHHHERTTRQQLKPVKCSQLSTRDALIQVFGIEYIYFLPVFVNTEKRSIDNCRLEGDLWIYLLCVFRTGKKTPFHPQFRDRG